MNREKRTLLGVDQNKPTDWFETLYSNSDETGKGVPWANLKPHPLFKKWIDTLPSLSEEKTALVVGCGMGDDAIELGKKGYRVTAFDVSESAIRLCKKRFPDSTVEFVYANLLEDIPEWHAKFDFVLEIFTIQALPPQYEKTVIAHISDFVGENGELLVITKTQTAKRIYKNGPPWLLNNNYIESFEKNGLQNIFHSRSDEPQKGQEIHLALFKK